MRMERSCSFKYYRCAIITLCWVVLCWVACSNKNAESYYHEGRALREQNRPIAAMEAFIASTRTCSRDYAIKGRSYSNMATMCRMGEQHALAYSLYEQSALLFSQAHDTLAYAYALNNMAWEKAVQGNKYEAYILADSSEKVCPAIPIKTKTIETRAAACLYACEYDSVLYYISNLPILSDTSTYLDILCAQAYTFLEVCDSALYYSRLVLNKTDNPRYLDDVYYIFTHCDSTAAAEEIRNWASTRSDIQRTLECNNPEWAQAMNMAELSIQPKSPLKPAIFVIAGAALFLAVLYLIYVLIYRKKACSLVNANKKEELERQCRALRHSKVLKEELQWDDYSQFSKICNTRLSGIVDKLQQCGMNEREIRLCILFLIGLPYAEIAKTLYRAESGIGKDKYLVSKRLGVTVKSLQTTLFEIASAD